MAFHHTAFRKLDRRPGALDRIAIVERHLGMLEREHANERLLLLRLLQPPRQLCDRRLVEHHNSSSTIVLRRMPRLGDSTSTTSPGTSHFGGSKRAPAPVGVPVAMRSPGF